MGIALHICNCTLWNPSHNRTFSHVPKDSWNVVCELCLMPGGAKMWLIAFHIIALIML